VFCCKWADSLLPFQYGTHINKPLCFCVINFIRPMVCVCQTSWTAALIRSQHMTLYKRMCSIWLIDWTFVQWTGFNAVSRLYTSFPIAPESGRLRWVQSVRWRQKTLSDRHRRRRPALMMSIILRRSCGETFRLRRPKPGWPARRGPVNLAVVEDETPCRRMSELCRWPESSPSAVPCVSAVRSRPPP